MITFGFLLVRLSLDDASLSIGMSSTNSYLSSTAYQASNARYARSVSPSNGNISSFNIRSTNVQQPLNDLNSTRSSTSTCSRSHCLSNQCLECTTTLSTRPFQNRCQISSFIDSTSNSSSYPTNGYHLVTTTSDHHSTLVNNDDSLSSSARILSMNIPVDNSNNLQSNSNPLQTSSLNIEIENNRDEDQIEIINHEDEDHHDEHLEHQQHSSQRHHLFNENPEENEQLEVFVGFYRPGEYERENIEEDDDDEPDDDMSDHSQKFESQKKEEQVCHVFLFPFRINAILTT